MSEKTYDEIYDEEFDEDVLHYFLVLDQSGSMTSIQDEIIEGFNETVQELHNLQESAQVPIRVSLVVFSGNKNISVPIKRQKVGELDPLTKEDYEPGGMTALFDGIMKGIRVVKDWDTSGNVVGVIMTDGKENSSTKHDLQEVKQAIKDQEEKGWEFHFLGAGRDVITEAYKMGVDTNNTQSWTATSDGVSAAYGNTTLSVRNYVTSEYDVDEDTLTDPTEVFDEDD